MKNAYCFVDGGYLRGICKEEKRPLVDPRKLASNVAYSEYVQNWGTWKGRAERRGLVRLPDLRLDLGRVIYYDAEPEKPDALIQEYWNQVELLDDTQLGFGVVRGRGKKQRQKGVDGLIAVDMLEGAFNGIYDVAILVAGDADFVPVVQAVHRRGVMVLVVAQEKSLAGDLKRAADRVWLIEPSDIPQLQRLDEQCWYEDADGSLRLDKG